MARSAATIPFGISQRNVVAVTAPVVPSESENRFPLIMMIVVATEKTPMSFAVSIDRGRLEYAADIGPGDLAYFSPNVPHQEFNPHAEDTVYLVVRSDLERIVNPLEEKPVATPERVA